MVNVWIPVHPFVWKCTLQYYKTGHQQSWWNFGKVPMCIYLKNFGKLTLKLHNACPIRLKSSFVSREKSINSSYANGIFFFRKKVLFSFPWWCVASNLSFFLKDFLRLEGNIKSWKKVKCVCTGFLTLTHDGYFLTIFHLCTYPNTNNDCSKFIFHITTWMYFKEKI